MDDCKAQVVLNCVGIVKQAAAASDPVASISINSLFPHQLAQLTAKMGIRLIHFSTDCVFSGQKGSYTEADTPDPMDLYGRSKLLGEVAGHQALTLRTSIVGRELRGHLGLIDWFVSQRGKRVNGYVHALYSGLTTTAAAELVSLLIRKHADLQGLWQVSGNPISKFDLLGTVNRLYNLGIDLTPDEIFRCDRRLDSTRFRRHTGWQPASWEEMIADLYLEELTYGSAYSDLPANKTISFQA
jgi:dTDP-4-dehydrorhamnose reductase